MEAQNLTRKRYIYIYILMVFSETQARCEPLFSGIRAHFSWLRIVAWLAVELNPGTHTVTTVALRQTRQPPCVTRTPPSLGQQGKSEGFESCDRPIVRKRPIWVKIGDVLSRVTLKFDGWPWKTIGHLSFAVWSFVQHFIAIGEFKLELLTGNAQFGSNSTIFRAVWPWNLTYDLEKQ